MFRRKTHQSEIVGLQSQITEATSQVRHHERELETANFEHQEMEEKLNKAKALERSLNACITRKSAELDTAKAQVAIKSYCAS